MSQNNDKKFSQIYVHNFKGVWSSVTGLWDMYPSGPLTVIVQFLLLPVTLTIGAVVKSLIDFFSRKTLNETVIETVQDKLNNMNDKEIRSVIKGIQKQHPYPHSKSSIFLLKELNNSEAKEYQITHYPAKSQMLYKIIKKMKQPMTSQINDRPLYDERIDPDKHNIVTVEDANQRILISRTKLGLFLNESHNAGKKMQHVICDAVLSVSQL
ncbi:MAG: hypothetical protein Q8M40_06385 [Legionella sp.]|nr:hypothetical protein [Legionella sp.]